MKQLVYIVVVFVLFCATQARADLDYQCLHTCVNNGAPITACQQECEYNNKTIKQAAPKANHKVFTAPKPIGNAIIAPSKIKEAPKAKMDYTCLNHCLQDGLQYQLCSTQCSSVACPKGQTRCDVSGTNQQHVFTKNSLRPAN